MKTYWINESYNGDGDKQLFVECASLEDAVAIAKKTFFDHAHKNPYYVTISEYLLDDEGTSIDTKEIVLSFK